MLDSAGTLDYDAGLRGTPWSLPEDAKGPSPKANCQKTDGGGPCGDLGRMATGGSREILGGPETIPGVGISHPPPLDCELDCEHSCPFRTHG